MSSRRWQFSLRGLFIATTLVAACIFFVLQFPVLAICSLVGLVLALLQYGAERLIGNVTARTAAIARVMFAVVGIGFVAFGVFLWVHASRNAPPEHLASRWLPLAMFGGIGALCCYAAFTLPDKPPPAPMGEPVAADERSRERASDESR